MKLYTKSLGNKASLYLKNIAHQRIVKRLYSDGVQVCFFLLTTTRR